MGSHTPKSILIACERKSLGFGYPFRVTQLLGMRHVFHGSPKLWVYDSYDMCFLTGIWSPRRVFFGFSFRSARSFEASKLAGAAGGVGHAQGAPPALVAGAVAGRQVRTPGKGERVLSSEHLEEIKVSLKSEKNPHGHKMASICLLLA